MVPRGIFPSFKSMRYKVVFCDRIVRENALEQHAGADSKHRQVDSDEIGDRGEDGFEEIIVKDTTYYQPYVDDVNKRIKLHLTPVRDDGLHGPTYQHIIDPLSLPFRLQVFI